MGSVSKATGKKYQVTFDTTASLFKNQS